MTDLFHVSPNGKKLAYRQIAKDRSRPNTRSFIWLSGFKSDMTGTKVVELEAWAKANGHGFLAFDYSGHGVSEGDFVEGTIGEWRSDVLAMIDDLTTGPQILVGSSMGGWMALLGAMARPDLIEGLVLIAPAPDFTQKLMWPGLTDEEQREVLEKGVYYQPSDYDEPLPLTRKLIEEGADWQILDEPISFEGPVRILQGMQDQDVPWKHAEQLVETVTSPDLIFHLIKDGDHRLSREQDIRRLISTCEEIAASIAS